MTMWFNINMENVAYNLAVAVSPGAYPTPKQQHTFLEPE